MGKLPVVSGRQAVRALSKAGWVPERQHGSHLILAKEGRQEVLSVPLHAELRRGLLRAPIRAAGMSVDEFLGFL